MLGSAPVWRGARCAGGIGLPHAKTRSWDCCGISAGAATEDGFSLASDTTGVTGLAERYAAALFELADERRMLDEVASNLRELQAMLRASDDLARLIRSPVLSREEQSTAVRMVAERAGLSPLVCNFLSVIAANRRLFALLAMIQAFLAALARRRGEVTAQIAAAQPLSEAQLAALSEQLRRASGSRVSVDLQVDPTLIGGIIIKLGSRMIDASIKSKLQRLQLALKSVA
jgi:F-type H+-transporting ATPase subunit delta